MNPEYTSHAYTPCYPSLVPQNVVPVLAHTNSRIITCSGNRGDHDSGKDDIVKKTADC